MAELVDDSYLQDYSEVLDKLPYSPFYKKEGDDRLRLVDRSGSNIKKILEEADGLDMDYRNLEGNTLLEEYDILSYEDIANITRLRSNLTIGVDKFRFKNIFNPLYKSLSKKFPIDTKKKFIKIIDEGILKHDTEEIGKYKTQFGFNEYLSFTQDDFVMGNDDFKYTLFKNYKEIYNLLNESSRKQTDLEKLKEKFPEAEEKQLEYIVENDLNKKLLGGYSSKIVLASDNFVAKQADKEKNNHEAKIYNWKLPEFDNYRPKFKEIIDLSNSSLLVTSNVMNEKSAYFKSGFIPFNKDGTFNKDIYIKHNLYLMGLFHKEAKVLPKEEKSFLKDMIYKTLDGIPHYEAINIPLDNIDNATLKEFKKSIPQDLSKKLKPIIDSACKYIIESKDGTVIDGDWKPGNINNGYKLDYQIVRYGKEIEDIMNFLSDPILNVTYQERLNYVNQYVGMRSEHDNEFKYDKNKHKEMLISKDSINAKELSIYGSCSRKRPLDKKVFMDRRNNILYNAEELVKIGNFM